jgi:hypothetical protein
VCVCVCVCVSGERERDSVRVCLSGEREYVCVGVSVCVWVCRHIFIILRMLTKGKVKIKPGEKSNRE